MSLLNQVLQDLDDRAPPGEPDPVRLSVAPPAKPYAADQDDARPDWVRLGAGVAVVVAFVAAVWVFYGADEGRGKDMQAAQGPISPPVSAASSTPVAEPVLPIVVEAAPVAHGTGDSGARPAPVAAMPTAQIMIAGPEVLPVKRTEPPVTGDSAALITPPPADQQGSNKNPSVPSAIDYLSLRNTELSFVEEATFEAAPMKPRTGVTVKTRKAPVPQVAEEARVAIEEGELSSAEAMLQRRLRLAPGDREARELLVGLMLRGERYAAAVQQLDQGLKQHPGHVKFLLIKARLLAQSGEVATAIKVLERSTPSGDGRVERLQMLGALYQQQSRYDQAVDSYRRLLELNSSVGTSWVGLAISLDGLGDSAALEAYGRALWFGGLPAAAESYARQRVSQLELTVD